MYDFTTNRTRDGPARFLSGYAGYLQADGYSDYYRESPVDDPDGPPSSAVSCRVFRGGGWFHHAGHCRSAARRWGEPWSSTDYLGFRVAADPPAGQPSSSN